MANCSVGSLGWIPTTFLKISTTGKRQAEMDLVTAETGVSFLPRSDGTRRMYQKF